MFKTLELKYSGGERYPNLRARARCAGPAVADRAPARRRALILARNARIELSNHFVRSCDGEVRVE